MSVVPNPNFGTGLEPTLALLLWAELRTHSRLFCEHGRTVSKELQGHPWTYITVVWGWPSSSLDTVQPCSQHHRGLRLTDKVNNTVHVYDHAGKFVCQSNAGVVQSRICLDDETRRTTALFLSLQRLFWNQTRITRALSPVISISWSLVAASGRGETA